MLQTNNKKQSALVQNFTKYKVQVSVSNNTIPFVVIIVIFTSTLVNKKQKHKINENENNNEQKLILLKVSVKSFVFFHKIYFPNFYERLGELKWEKTYEFECTLQHKLFTLCITL